MDRIEILKIRKKATRLTFDDLAKKSGIPKKTLSNIFRGLTKNPRIDTLEAIERALGISSSISTQNKKSPTIEGEVEFNDLYKIPLLGRVVAGIPLESEENLEGFVYISFKPKEDYFALRVNGNSMMNAGITDKSIIIVHKQETAECGDIVVAMLNGETTVKRFKRFGNNMIFLMPENPAFEPIPVAENSDFLILGKVVEVRIAF